SSRPPGGQLRVTSSEVDDFCVPPARWSARPPSSWNRDLDPQNLTVPGRLPAEGSHPGPAGCEYIQVWPLCSTEHAGEPAPVERHRGEPLTALGHPHAPLMRYVGVPRRTLGIEADAVWCSVAQVGPHPAAGEPAVRADVE